MASAAGVTKAWETRCSASSLARSSPPKIDAGAITCVDAALIAIMISKMDASKLGDAKCKTRDDEVSENRGPISANRLARPRWVTPTPLGRPVEPEVKITYARSSRTGGCTRNEAGASPPVSTVRRPYRSIISSDTGSHLAN